MAVVSAGRGDSGFGGLKGRRCGHECPRVWRKGDRVGGISQTHLSSDWDSDESLLKHGRENINIRPGDVR